MIIEVRIPPVDKGKAWRWTDFMKQWAELEGQIMMWVPMSEWPVRITYRRQSGIIRVFTPPALDNTPGIIIIPFYNIEKII